MLARLQKVLAAAGVASRRQSENLISSGRVTVDGRVVSEVGLKVDPDVSTVAVDGEPLTRDIPHLYIILNKPTGWVTTRRDRHAPRTVMDLVQPGLRSRYMDDARYRSAVSGLHPVGRLDEDTSGVLLLTNDGELTHLLTHPSHQVGKVYHARVRGVPDAAMLRRLRDGIDLDDGRTAPAEARLCSTDARGAESVIELELREGRKRQARRMLCALGLPVLSLRRVRFGPIRVDALREGEWRFLTQSEVRSLHAAVHPRHNASISRAARGPKGQPRIKGESPRTATTTRKR